MQRPSQGEQGCFELRSSERKAPTKGRNSVAAFAARDILATRTQGSQTHPGLNSQRCSAAHLRIAIRRLRIALRRSPLDHVTSSDLVTLVRLAATQCGKARLTVRLIYLLSQATPAGRGRASGKIKKGLSERRAFPHWQRHSRPFSKRGLSEGGSLSE